MLTRFRHPYRLLALLLLLPLSLANAGEEERIQAVSEFLIQRAEANLMYSFENRLKKDPELKCYFPATYAHIMQGNLRILIGARAEWQYSLESDIDTLVVRAVAHELASGVDLSRDGLEATNAYLDVASFIDVEYQGQSYPITLNLMPGNGNDELNELINGFYSDFLALRDQFNALNKLLSGFASNNPCAMPNMSSSEFKQAVSRLSGALEGMRGLSQHIQQYGSSLRLDTERFNDSCATNPEERICRLRGKAIEQWLPELKQQLDRPVIKVSASLAVLGVYIKQTEGQDYTSRVLRAVDLLKQGGMNEARLDRLKNNVLFFARLADAGSKEEAMAVLQEYTLPPVSFMIKRHPAGSHHWLLSSYLGYAGGQTLNGVDKGNAYQGMFVPLGLEYSHALDGGDSVSLLLAPFDFGYPVSLQLNGSDLGVGIDQVVAPSLSLSYGFADYPLAVGFSMQQGRDSGSGDTRVSRAMLFVAFDMPLLQLY